MPNFPTTRSPLGGVVEAPALTGTGHGDDAHQRGPSGPAPALNEGEHGRI